MRSVAEERGLILSLMLLCCDQTLIGCWFVSFIRRNYVVLVGLISLPDIGAKDIGRQREYSVKTTKCHSGRKYKDR